MKTILRVTKDCEFLQAWGYSGVAADKNVRAPSLTEKPPRAAKKQIHPFCTLNSQAVAAPNCAGDGAGLAFLLAILSCKGLP